MSHPEERAATRWMRGRTVEIGAGSNPTPGSHVTVDHTPGGQPGTAGSQHNQTSLAAICADMAALPFPARQFDTLVARHVLEHHPDTLTVLREWARVAGRLVVICPDQDTHPGSTIALDPTHCAAFTPAQLAATATHAGLCTVTLEGVIDGWSFLLVAEQPVGNVSHGPNRHGGSTPAPTGTSSGPSSSRHAATGEAQAAEARQQCSTTGPSTPGTYPPGTPGHGTPPT